MKRHFNTKRYFKYGKARVFEHNLRLWSWEEETGRTVCYDNCNRIFQGAIASIQDIERLTGQDYWEEIPAAEAVLMR